MLIHLPDTDLSISVKINCSSISVNFKAYPAGCLQEQGRKSEENRIHFYFAFLCFKVAKTSQQKPVMYRTPFIDNGSMHQMKNDDVERLNEDEYMPWHYNYII